MKLCLPSTAMLMIVTSEKQNHCRCTSTYEPEHLDSQLLIIQYPPLTIKQP